jgi:hypothetical protein
MKVTFRSMACTNDPDCCCNTPKLTVGQSDCKYPLTGQTKYKVLQSFDVNDKLYYMLNGWGALLFNAACFDVSNEEL